MRIENRWDEENWAPRYAQDVPDEKQQEKENRKLKRSVVFEKIWAYLYLALALAGFIYAPFVYTGNLAGGYMRYGIILPIFFTWYGFRCLKKAKELKEELDYASTRERTAKTN